MLSELKLKLYVQEKSSMSYTASRMTSKRPREEEEFVYSRKIGL